MAILISVKSNTFDVRANHKTLLSLFPFIDIYLTLNKIDLSWSVQQFGPFTPSPFS